MQAIHTRIQWMIWWISGRITPVHLGCHAYEKSNCFVIPCGHLRKAKPVPPLAPTQECLPVSQPQPAPIMTFQLEVGNQAVESCHRDHWASPRFVADGVELKRLMVEGGNDFHFQIDATH